MASLEGETSTVPRGLLECEPLPSYREIIAKSLVVGLAQATMFVVTLINSIVIGGVKGVDDAEQVAMQAGLGLALTMQAVTVFGLAAGIAGACDTIVSQAAGAGDMLGCALCLGKIRTLLAFHWLIIVLPLALTYERLLVACGFEAVASHYAGLYLRILLPGMFFRCQTTLLRRFLPCMGQPWILPWATALQVVVHLCLLLCLGFWVPIDVVALVTNVTYAVPSLFMMCYIVWRPHEFKLQRKWLLQYAFVFHDLGFSFRLGICSAVQSIAEELAMQTFTLMSTRLGDVAVAASSICFNMSGSIYAIGIGSSATAAGLVGASIGRGQPSVARRIAWRCVTVAGFLGLPFVIGFLFGASVLSARFSQQKTLRDDLSPLLRILGFSQCLEFVNLTWCSILRAVNRPKIGPGLIVCFYYPVMIPLAWVFAFPLGLGTFGMWLSYTNGCLIVCGILTIIVWQTSFENVATARR